MSCKTTLRASVPAPPPESAIERGELAALAQLLVDAPCGLGRLRLEEVEALVGSDFMFVVPMAERGVAYLQWLELLRVLRRWQRERPGDDEALHREAVSKAFIETAAAAGDGCQPAEVLAQRLCRRHADFRQLNPGLSEAAYWLAPEALARWSEGVPVPASGGG